MDYCTTIPNGGSKNNTSSLPTSEVAGSSSSSSSTSKGTNNKKNKKGNNTKKISTNNNNNNSNKGVMKLSTDPQSVAARERRHRISDRFKILQSMVPGGTKMDTVSMLEEAIHYVKFLKTQIWLHQTMMMMNNNNNYFVDVNDESSPKMLLSSTDQCYNFSVSEQSNNVPMIQQNTSSELPLGQGIITFDDHSIFKTWQP